jgi:hypothetical protein
MRTRSQIIKLDTDLEYKDEDQMRSPHESQWRENSLGPGHAILLHLQASNSDKGFNSVAKARRSRLRNWLHGTIIHAEQMMRK